MDIIKKLSVVIDGQTIANKNSAETFVYSINYLSNKVGKEKLTEDFPKIFSKLEFFWKTTIREDRKVRQSIDDSGEYYIFTNTNTERKKNTLEYLYQNYNIDIEVSIIEELIEDEILSNIKYLFQNDGNTPMTSEEVSNKLKKKEDKINEILLISDFFDCKISISSGLSWLVLLFNLKIKNAIRRNSIKAIICHLFRMIVFMIY